MKAFPNDARIAGAPGDGVSSGASRSRVRRALGLLAALGLTLAGAGRVAPAWAGDDESAPGNLQQALQRLQDKRLKEHYAKKKAPRAKLVSASRGQADIVGVKLGMTPAQAMAALNASERKFEITQVHHKLTAERAVPASPKDPKAYVAEISARHDGPRRGFSLPDSTDRIEVKFALPPDANRVIEISRQEQPHKAARKDYVGSLHAKYGKPGRVHSRSQIWQYGPKTVDCNPYAGSRYRWPKTELDLPAPPERCATALVIEVSENAGIVKDASFRLANAGEMIRNGKRHRKLKTTRQGQTAAADKEDAKSSR